MRWWRILGLAGFAGVAATGVVIARAERARRAYTPDEIREQLHSRLAAADDAGTDAVAGPRLPPAARHAARVDGSAHRAAGSAGSGSDAATAGGRRLPGWRHGSRRPPRHHPRLRPHRR